MRRSSTIGWLLGAAVIAAGCGGTTGNGGTTAAQESRDVQELTSATPIGADEQLEDVRLLAMDLASQSICGRVEGQLMAVGGEGDDPAEGRMWIRGCQASVEDEELVLDVDAVLWSWVDRGSSAVGADFEVSQYVGLDADIQFRVIPHVRYERDRRHAFVWLEPVAEPQVSVRTMGNVDAEAQSLWGEFVAFAAGVFGPSENERAAARVREEGGARLERRVDEGVTFAMDLCTTEYAAELGRMTEMPATEEPDRGAPGDSTNVRVHPMGFDAAGPFRADEVTVEVTDGSPVHARLVCAADAHRMVEAFLDGGLDDVPEVEAVAEAEIEAGRTTTLRAERDPGCDLALVTQVVPSGEASATYSYAEEPPTPMPMVAGCTPALEEPQSAPRASAEQGSQAQRGSEAQARAER